VAKKNKEWLVNTCGVDEEDADDILEALAAKNSSSGGGGGGELEASTAAAQAAQAALERERLLLQQQQQQAAQAAQAAQAEAEAAARRSRPVPAGVANAIWYAADNNDIAALIPLCEQWAGNTQAIDGHKDSVCK